jgi:hypothetical protein
MRNGGAGLMNDLMDQIGAALDAGEDLEELIPYDLSGFSENNRIQVLSIYITYGKDPARVEICRQKLKECWK